MSQVKPQRVAPPKQGADVNTMEAIDAQVGTPPKGSVYVRCLPGKAVFVPNPKNPSVTMELSESAFPETKGWVEITHNELQSDPNQELLRELIVNSDGPHPFYRVKGTLPRHQDQRNG